MNKFVFVRAATPELYALAWKKLAQHALGSLTFHPDRIFVKTWADTLSFLASFQISESGGFRKDYWHEGANWHEGADCVTTFDGLPYGASIDPGRPWAEQIAAAWTTDECLLENLSGNWCALSNGERGGRCLSDFAGMAPLFYWSDQRYLAVSPRQMLLSRICGDGAVDLRRLAWLTGQANVIGSDTVWKGVRHLPPQWTLEFSNQPGDVRPEFVQRELWTRHIDAGFDDAEVDRAVESLVEQANALARLPLPPIRLDISGGLDSRLVAAIAKASHLSNRVSKLWTSGLDGSPEVQVGKQVADILGWPHEHTLPQDPGRSNIDSVVRLAEECAFRYEGSIPSTDCPSSGTRSSQLVFSGWGGEMYRRHCKPHLNVDVRDVEGLAELFQDYHQKTDPLGIEHPWIAEAQRQELQRIALSFARRGVDRNDVSDVFYLRFRLPLWSGVILNNTCGDVRVCPLVNLRIGRFAFSLGYKERIRDRIHFEALLRLNPKLCAAPFYKAVWPEEFRQKAARRRVRVAQQPFGAGAPVPLGVVYGNMQVVADSICGAIRDRLLGETSSRLWEIVDRRALEAVLEKWPTWSESRRGIVERKQLAALFGMHATLKGPKRLSIDGDPGKPPELFGVVAHHLFG